MDVRSASHPNLDEFQNNSHLAEQPEISRQIAENPQQFQSSCDDVMHSAIDKCNSASRKASHYFSDSEITVVKKGLRKPRQRSRSCDGNLKGSLLTNPQLDTASVKMTESSFKTENVSENLSSNESNKLLIGAEPNLHLTACNSQVLNSAFDETSFVPNVITSSDKNPSSSANNTYSSQSNASHSQEVASNFPEVASNFPEVASNFPEVASNFPEVASSFPEDAANFPEEASNSPNDPFDSPEVASDSPKDAPNSLKDSTNSPKDSTNSPEIPSTSQESTSNALSSNCASNIDSKEDLNESLASSDATLTANDSTISPETVKDDKTSGTTRAFREISPTPSFQPSTVRRSFHQRSRSDFGVSGNASTANVNNASENNNRGARVSSTSSAFAFESDSQDSNQRRG